MAKTTPRTKKKELTITPEKSFRQVVNQSTPLYDVPPGGEVEAVIVSRWVGVIKSAAFMSGVPKNFEIKGLIVSGIVMPPTGRDWRTGPVWNVAGLVVKAGGHIHMLAKNITEFRRGFCVEFTIEAETEKDWQPKRR